VQIHSRQVTNDQNQIQSHVATDGSRSVSLSWCRAPSEIHDHVLVAVRQLRYCSCEVPSLTRGQVCYLSVTVTSNKIVDSVYIIFIYYTLLHGILMRMYVQYIQGLLSVRAQYSRSYPISKSRYNVSLVT
jgi:hypothetical protein